MQLTPVVVDGDRRVWRVSCDATGHGNHLGTCCRCSRRIVLLEIVFGKFCQLSFGTRSWENRSVSQDLWSLFLDNLTVAAAAQEGTLRRSRERGQADGPDAMHLHGESCAGWEIADVLNMMPGCV